MEVGKIEQLTHQGNISGTTRPTESLKSILAGKQISSNTLRFGKDGSFKEIREWSKQRPTEPGYYWKSYVYMGRTLQEVVRLSSKSILDPSAGLEIFFFDGYGDPMDLDYPDFDTACWRQIEDPPVMDE